jgi:hypothetical protein
MAARVFISYAHKDEALLAELAAQLRILERNGLIEHWHDRKIVPGEEWDHKIKTELESADIILLLVSHDFINSDYCWGVEVAKAIELHESGMARIIPIILRDCLWQEAPFAKVQGLPKDMRPVVDWPGRDAAFADVAHGIKRVVTELEGRNSARAAPAILPHPEAQPTAARPRPAPRGSRLPMKREFSDLDKDAFADEAYAAIKAYFESSLTELSGEEPTIDGRFKEIDAHRFTAAVYCNGKKVAACTVTLGGMHRSTSIMYANRENAPPNTCNEDLHIEHDDASLHLKPLMGVFHAGAGEPDGKMSVEEAAEYLWKLFVGQIH